MHPGRWLEFAQVLRVLSDKKRYHNAMIIEPVNDSPFGAKVTAFDCAAFDTKAADELRLALHRHQLLIFPGQQQLTPQQEVAFYRSIDLQGVSVWRDQTNNPWEVFKVAQGNKAGTYQIP